MKEIHHLLTRKADKTEYSEEPGYWYRTSLHRGYVVGLPDEDPSGWANFDDGRDVDRSEPVFFLHLATVDYCKDPKVEHCGLLLVKDAAQKEVYNRVGIGTASDITWMANASDVSTRIISDTYKFSSCWNLISSIISTGSSSFASCCHYKKQCQPLLRRLPSRPPMIQSCSLRLVVL